MTLEDAESLYVDFPEETGEGIRVAVIDTGVDPSSPAVGGVTAGARFVFGPAGAVVESSAYEDDFGHGTACASIIRKVAPRCSLLAVKVSERDEPIAPRLLVAGIDWAVAHRADVINVSAGTRGVEGAAILRDCCRRAADSGAVLVAAEGDDPGPTYPASLDTVVAVGGEATDRRWYAYRGDPHNPGRFASYGGYQRVPWLGGRDLFLCGSSFAAARLSGTVALILGHLGETRRHLLHQALQRNASLGADPLLGTTSSPDPAPARSRSIEWIRRAAVFPFSKEMHSLVRFRHRLPFELTGVADALGAGRIGKDAGEEIGSGPAGLVITANIEQALREADTLILGFTGRLGSLLRQDIGAEIAGKAVALGKNVFSFEPLGGPRHRPLHFAAARAGVRIAWPAVDEADLEALKRSVPRPVDYASTPILGVVGTSSSQGKWTLQLSLRERLQADGLRVGQIGTEHHSMLFGMDDCFPTGHVNNVSLRTEYWGDYFDLRYQQIQRDSDPDINIVGAQGGIVPHGASRPSDDSNNAYNLFFLWPSRADSYILVVNHLDDDRLIQDTIDVLRIIGKGRTILLALSDQRKKATHTFGRRLFTVERITPQEQAAHIGRLEDRFGIPTFSILDGADRMLDIVLKAYSARSPSAGAAPAPASAVATERPGAPQT